MIHRFGSSLGTTRQVVNCLRVFNFKDDSQAIKDKNRELYVVNCLRVFNFKDDSQVQKPNEPMKTSCELLTSL